MIDYIFIETKKEKRGTVLMIPGFAHTKEHFLETPDKRKGWAYNFSDQGYDVYCINWPGIKTDVNFDNEKVVPENIVNDIADFIKNKIKSKTILLVHSAAGPFGWKLAEVSPNIEIVIGIAPGGPGNIQAVPEVREISKSEIEVFNYSTPYLFDVNKAWQPTDDWIKNKLIGTSKFFPSEAYLSYKDSLICVPSKVLYGRMNINSSQIKVDPVKIREHGTKMFIFTGTEDPAHAREVDGAIDIWFRENGIKSEFHWLGDEGFIGNGHMLMLEKNSKEIAKHIINIIRDI